MDKTENELIAEFMGLHVAMHGPVLYLSDEDGYIDFVGDAEPYWPNKSWNQLMPVVEKIGKIELPDGQYGKYIDFSISSNDGIGWIFWTKNVPGDQNQPQSYPTEGTMIEKTHKAVVEFIKWYNSQKL